MKCKTFIFRPVKPEVVFPLRGPQSKEKYGGDPKPHARKGQTERDSVGNACKIAQDHVPRKGVPTGSRG